MGKLTVNNLVKKFGESTAVNDVSLTVEDGDLLTVVGPSGCGKTTFLRMVAGFIEPTAGVIKIDEHVLSNRAGGIRDVPPENRDIGMVFQSYAVWPHMNVFNNVAYPLKIRKQDKATIKQSVMTVLKLVHLDGYEERMAYELSGGQQQRVALARALVMRPRLLLLDEPLSNLDAALRETMRGEIKEIQKKLGITIINVTHDQIEAMTMSDKVAVMRLGNLVQFDTPNNLYEHPVNTFVAQFIGSANIIPSTIEKDVKADKEGMMDVKLLGKWPMKAAYAETEKKEGFLAIRAHHVLYTPDSPIRAKVVRKLYQGNQFEYFLALDEDVTIRMLASTTLDFDIGDTIPVSMDKTVWLDD
ncbi:MAG: ABC transporter ATP-binding protein [Christensenella sp.]|uniref:ABC transporter ATP-binding protein n=1 Tax=Christensenella sp. TaxID=1935934 RepID=UPI002B209899|nr:ABC transporter ATP-binding protein [Christensenella sp.]MEA5004568.1 ABC transporter ATP-binding protein [Christensenella sp.]